MVLVAAIRPTMTMTVPASAAAAETKAVVWSISTDCVAASIW